jgi:transposase-like protein
MTPSKMCRQEAVDARVAYGMGERVLLMKFHEQGRSLKAWSRETGVPRQILSGWWKRYQQGGVEGPRPQLRRPQRSPRRIAALIERRILQTDSVSGIRASSNCAGNRGDSRNGVSCFGSARAPSVAARGAPFDPPL